MGEGTLWQEEEEEEEKHEEEEEGILWSRAREIQGVRTPGISKAQPRLCARAKPTNWQEEKKDNANSRIPIAIPSCGAKVSECSVAEDCCNVGVSNAYTA